MSYWDDDRPVQAAPTLTGTVLDALCELWPGIIGGVVLAGLILACWYVMPRLL